MTYPALRHLLQAYFNPDWPEDYADSWGAVDDFAANEPIARLLPDEVTEAIRSKPSEVELRMLVLDELDSSYLPSADGYAMKDWLLAVRQRVVGVLADVDNHGA